MEEFDHPLIHEKRTKTERQAKPSEAFARHSGVQHGIVLLPSARYGYESLLFSGEGGE